MFQSIARIISEIERNHIFALRDTNHLLLDPTYTLIESRYSILPLFCTTHSHRSIMVRRSIDNDYYVAVMGNTFTVLEMYRVTSSNMKPCVLKVNEFFPRYIHEFFHR